MGWISLKASRAKPYLTIENYMLRERQLWEADGHEHVHNGSCASFSAKLKYHVFTPACIGEIRESSGRRNIGDGLGYNVRAPNIESLGYCVSGRMA